MTSSVAAFDETGYLTLPAALPADLRDAVRDAWHRGWARDRDGINAGAWVPMKIGDRTVPAGGDPLKLLESGPVLRLIAQPPVLSAVRSIVGADALPAITWSLKKRGGDGHVIRWHQDSLYESPYRVVTVGFHIDGVAPSETLYVVPASHTAAQDMDRVEAAIAAGDLEVRRLPAAAEDVLIHDSMLVHGSAARTEPGSRLTIYVEYRSAAHILNTEDGVEDWVAARRALVALAERLVAEQRDPDAGEVEIVDRVNTLHRVSGMRNQSFRDVDVPYPSLPRSA